MILCWNINQGDGVTLGGSLPLQKATKSATTISNRAMSRGNMISGKLLINPESLSQKETNGPLSLNGRTERLKEGVVRTKKPR
jgi:hypothetical protein